MFSANSSQVSDDKLFVEDVFSTYLYSGVSGAASINNGINLSGKGGLVWLKCRNVGFNHILIDTAQGCTFAGGKNLISNSTNGAGTIAANTFQFDSTGFSFGSAASGGAINATGQEYASWTFRKAPKFFDVVTYTGTGANRTIAHSLGVAPGCILVKRTDTTADWQVYHRSNANTEYMVLNTTAAKATGTTRWNSTTPTATEFTVGTDTTVNASGATYVAYLFAHDTTADGVIQCGSVTMAVSGDASVELGWEPQWVLMREVNHAGELWWIEDTMRGYAAQKTAGAMSSGTGGPSVALFANTSDAEPSYNYGGLTSTGFKVPSNFNYGDGNTKFIYIAIRRGPMKTPTLGTSVFAPVAFTSATPYVVTTNFPLDMIISSFRNITTGHDTLTRLTGDRNYLQTPFSSAEAVGGAQLIDFANNTGYTNSLNYSGTYNTIDYAFRRAPGFFDEVCWTGNGINPTSLNHNLGVAPELIITKKRNSTSNWTTGYAFTSTTYKYFFLNDTGAANSDTYASTPVYGGNPTSSVFIVGNQGNMNISGDTYVSYLFASCPGVSKVGSYTGNGSSQTINCGFAAGARFVLIKRTNASGDWYVWDTARGIVAGNDPHLSLNTTAAEVTTDDTIDTDSSGFVVNQVAATNVNVSSATYIYLAIA